MEREAITDRFVARVNQGLAENADFSRQIYDELQAAVEDEAEQILLDALYENYHAAQRPVEFFNERVEWPGLRLDQCYELLRLVLDPEILDAKAYFVNSVNVSRSPSQPLTSVIIGRFWRVSGSQVYDPVGRLKTFQYDPMAVSEHVASVVAGDYMPMEMRSGEGIGALAQLATRPYLRQRQGHGRTLSDAFEQTIYSIAAARDETLRLILLESEAAARPFWSKMGYCWPEGSRYVQPPIDYNPTTGEPLFAEVPELLMVKLCGQPGAASIERSLLVGAVQTVYERWYIPKHLSADLTSRIREYVIGKLFAEFVASLPERDTIPLVDPPFD